MHQQFKTVRSKMKCSFIILFLITSAISVAGQQNNSIIETVQECSGKLKAAEASYQTGQYIKCINALENILDSCDLTKKEKQQALELLAKSYVETNEMDKADATVNLLLKKFPHYDLIESENPEQYNRLVKKYKIHPLITIGVKNTANWLQHKTTGVYSVLDGLDYSQPQAKAPYWFTYYGMAEYEFKYGISANIDLNVLSFILSKGYKYRSHL